MLIGDVARHSGVSTRMLRHYDALGLVRPTGRTAVGYREYSDEDVRRIFQVESLRSLGLSLKQVARALEDPACTPSALVGDLIRWTENRLERERELLERLRAIDASAPTGWPDVLRVVELMRGLNSASAARRQQAVLAPLEGVSVPVELLAEAVLAESDPHVAGALRWALARSGGDGVVSLGRRPALGGRSMIRRRAVVDDRRVVPTPPGRPRRSRARSGTGRPTVRRRAALALGQAWRHHGRADTRRHGGRGRQRHRRRGGPGNAVRGLRGRGERSRTRWSTNSPRTPPTPPLRIRLTQALVELPGTTARDVLRRLAQDERPRCRPGRLGLRHRSRRAVPRGPRCREP